MNDRLLERANALLKYQPRTAEESVAWAANVTTILETLRGSKHPSASWLRSFVEAAIPQRAYQFEGFDSTVRGVLLGLLNDLEAGLIPDLQTRIRSDVEADLLSQAHRILEQGFKDPAAMLIGAVLEDGLRQLCRKNGVHEGDAIEAMNVPLRKADVYGLPQQQQVTAWAAIRNKADHGLFGEYTIEEVRVMHLGVSGFIAAYLGSS